MAPGIGNVLPTLVHTPVFPSKGQQPQPSLHHHSLITADSDALQFHAAASLQLKSGRFQDNAIQQAPSSSDLLITSPYNEPLHLLDLKTLDKSNQLLAKALTILQPIREDYATAPYLESLNWQTVFDFLRELSEAEGGGYQWKKQSFYVVTFHSRLFPDADPDRVAELDLYSHREATVSGGLLKYWFGKKNGNCENMATCLWRSREDARNGGTGPWHRQARQAARELYERIDFKTLELVIEDGVSGWEMHDWAHV